MSTISGSSNSSSSSSQKSSTSNVSQSQSKSQETKTQETKSSEKSSPQTENESGKIDTKDKVNISDDAKEETAVDGKGETAETAETAPAKDPAQTLGFNQEQDACAKNVINYAKEHNLPPSLLLSMAQGESGMNPNAKAETSIENSYGLFQVNTDVHGGPASKWMGADGAKNAMELMGPRWESAFQKCGGLEAYNKDPAGFMKDFWPKAQGCVAPSAEKCRDITARGLEISKAYGNDPGIASPTGNPTDTGTNQTGTPGIGDAGNVSPGGGAGAPGGGGGTAPAVGAGDPGGGGGGGAAPAGGGDAGAPAGGAAPADGAGNVASNPQALQAIEQSANQVFQLCGIDPTQVDQQIQKQMTNEGNEQTQALKPQGVKDPQALQTSLQMLDMSVSQAGGQLPQQTQLKVQMAKDVGQQAMGGTQQGQQQFGMNGMNGMNPFGMRMV